MDIHGSFHVNAVDCDPIVWCEHDDARVSIKLDRDVSGISMYIVGTTNELGDLLHALVAVVTERRRFEDSRALHAVIDAAKSHSEVGS